MDRIANSFRLVAQSYRLLMQDKELMILPLMAGVVMIAVACTFFVGLGVDPHLISSKHPTSMLPWFAFYTVSYTVGIYFQAAVVAGATERMRGGDPTIASSLAAANRRIGNILIWGLLAATVGMILRSVSERASFLGKIAIALVGAGWSIATFFIVPVLVLEDLSPADSFKRSLHVFTRAWGESFVGGVSLGIAGFAAWMTLVAIVGLLAFLGSAFLAVGVGVAGAIALLVFFNALNGVWVASLYRFAIDGHEPPGFDRDLLTGAFVPKKA